MNELLPCPFCGGEAELTGFNAPEYWVWCPTCKASADAHTGKENAIDAWNTRAYPYCQFSRPTHDEACVLVGELKKAKLNGVNLIQERTCKNVGYYIDGTRFKCSVCGYNGWTKWAKDGEDRVPNYCPSCGAKVVSE